MQRRIVSFTITLTMILGGFAGLITFETGIAAALNTHDPILIVGNANFTSANGVCGGNGTAADPYIIEGWDINASTGNGIEIRNTTAHFVIRNIGAHHGIYSGAKAGIYLYNVSHGRIENSNLENNYYSIYLELVSNLTISNNRIMNNTLGIDFIQYSPDNRVVENNISSNYMGIILMNDSDNNTFENNDMYDNGEVGIYVIGCDKNRILNNDISLGYGSGISLYQYSNDNEIIGNNITRYGNGINLNMFVENNNITDNVISYNGNSGIYSYYSSYNNISWNTLKNQGGQGIQLTLHSDHNEIYCNDIFSNFDGIYIDGNSDWNNMTGNVIENNDRYGIYIWLSGYNEIDYNTISFSQRGIVLHNSAETNMRVNEISHNVEDGIKIVSSESTNICSNDIHNNTDYGIQIDGGENYYIYNNRIHNHYSGLLLYDTSYDVVEENEVYSNDYGLEISSVIDLFLDSNIVCHNSEYGVNLVSCAEIKIRNCTMFNNDNHSIQAELSYDIQMKSNQIKNGRYPVSFLDCGMISMDNNALEGNGLYIVDPVLSNWKSHEVSETNTVNGKPLYYWKERTSATVPAGAGQVFLIDCNYTVVQNQELSNCSLAINLINSEYCIVENNTCRDNDNLGLYLDNSWYNTIKNNDLSHNGLYGMKLYGSYLNTIDSNICNSNNGTGIYLYSWSQMNTIQNNIAKSNNRYGIYIEESSNDNIVSSNTCNYNRWSGIFLDDVEDCIVRSNECNFNNNQGIYLNSVRYSGISDNFACSNEYSGIGMYDSSRNILEENILNSNIVNGLKILGEGSNTVRYNTCKYNVATGFYLDDSNDNKIHGNLIDSNPNHGLYLSISNYNTFTENAFSNNHYGIYFDNTGNNQVYHNNIVDNDHQAFDGSSGNLWNIDWPGGGNYWSDYAGKDELYGADRDKPGRDGFGDTPYIISDGVEDLYPLMKPYGNLPLAPENVTAHTVFGFVNVSWEPPSFEGSSPIKYYNIYSTSGKPDGYFEPVGFTSNLCFNDTSVYNGVKYFYKVRAVNIVGEGPASEIVNATPGSSPGKPLDVEAVDVDNSIVVTWSAPAHSGGYPVTGYRLYKGVEPGAEIMLSDLGMLFSYIDGNVTKGITYYYRVSAVNKHGEGSLSDRVNATIYTVPHAPINLSGTSGDRYINITWEPPYNTGGHPVLKYYIYRNTTAGDFEALAKNDPDQLWYNDTEVDNGVMYYYRLLAQNEEGKGPFSETIGVIPLRPQVKPGNEPPRAFISVDVTEGPPPLTVQFTGSGRDNDGVIMSYKWDFGDGVISTNQSPNHTYVSPGTYYVKLYVFDNDGGSGMAMVTIIVTADLPPGPGPDEDEERDEVSKSAWPVIALGVGAIAVVALILIMFVLPVLMRKPPPEGEPMVRPKREIFVNRIQKYKKERPEQDLEAEELEE